LRGLGSNLTQIFSQLAFAFLELVIGAVHWPAAGTGLQPQHH
jgi:hypothetical protein